MAEVALWTVAFTVVTAISILLTGSRALIGGTIDLPRMVQILFDWHFILGAGFAFLARLCFVMVNNSVLRVPGLENAATTITAFITSVALVAVVIANMLFLGERLTLQQSLGGVVIVVGIIIMTAVPGR
jgi:drug/metabolite transporter (DMT)-like permease